ncbi:MAG: hypothetical protein RIC12_00670, partial [Pirellulales bacterium]
VLLDRQGLISAVRRLFTPVERANSQRWLPWQVTSASWPRQQLSRGGPPAPRFARREVAAVYGGRRPIRCCIAGRIAPTEGTATVEQAPLKAPAAEIANLNAAPLPATCR